MLTKEMSHRKGLFKEKTFFLWVIFPFSCQPLNNYFSVRGFGCNMGGNARRTDKLTRWRGVGAND